MASIEMTEVHWLASLEPASLAQLQALVAASGWNQTEADWNLFFQQGRIGVCRDGAGRIVASGAVLPLGEHVAWISMILVLPEMRGEGLGGKIFVACLSEARRGARTACLDATPQGERLYVHHGFAPTEPLKRIARWRRDAASDACGTKPDPVRADAPSMHALASLDEQALGAPREALLAALRSRPGSRCVRGDQAWALVREGRVAHQIGPLLATDDASAVRLLEQALAGLSGAVLIDVPEPRAAMAHALRRAGFSMQRPFTRMALGETPPAGQAHHIYAIAGPEYG